jgi:hypothetical protein
MVTIVKSTIVKITYLNTLFAQIKEKKIAHGSTSSKDFKSFIASNSFCPNLIIFPARVTLHIFQPPKV